MRGSIDFTTRDAVGLIVGIIIAGLIGWGAAEITRKAHRGEIDTIVREMTYQKTYALGGLGEQERKNKYIDLSIRAWHVYGFTYHKPSKKYPVPQAMSKEQRVLVWEENFRLAELLGFANAKTGTGYYDVFIKGILESALNPNQTGSYGEEGWLQQKKVAVMQAAAVYDYMMPDRLKREIDFEWDGKLESVREPILALRIGYILMWYYRREYKSIETWYISLYHWGAGYLGKHFNNGTGRFPTRFVIDGIEYNPLLYYVSYRTLKEAFDDGDLEAGKPVVEKWNRYKARKIKEEEQLLQTHKTIRDLKKKLDALERKVIKKSELEAESKVLVEKLRASLDESEQKFKEIYRQIGKWKKGNLRAYMKSKGREIAKEFLEQITDHTSDNIVTIVILSGILLVVVGWTVVGIVGIRSLAKRRRDGNEI